MKHIKSVNICITQYAKPLELKRQLNGTHTRTNHRFGNILRQKCRAKGSGKEIRYKRRWMEMKRMCNRIY